MGCTGSKNIDAVGQESASKPSEAPTEIIESHPEEILTEKKDVIKEDCVLLEDNRNVVRAPETTIKVTMDSPPTMTPTETKGDDEAGAPQQKEEMEVMEESQVTDNEITAEIKEEEEAQPFKELVVEAPTENELVNPNEVFTEVVSSSKNTSTGSVHDEVDITPLEDALERVTDLEVPVISSYVPDTSLPVLHPTASENNQTGEEPASLEDPLEPVTDLEVPVISSDVPDTSLSVLHPTASENDQPGEEPANVEDIEVVPLTETVEIEVQDNLASAIVEEEETFPENDAQQEVSIITSDNVVTEAAPDSNTEVSPSDLSALEISPIAEIGTSSTPASPQSDASADENILSSANNTDAATVDNSMYHGSKVTQQQGVRDIIPRTDPTQPLSRRKSVKILEYEEAIKGEKELAQQRVSNIRHQRNVSAGLVVEEDGKVVVALSEQERVPIQAVLARASSYEPKHDLQRSASSGSGEH